MTYYRPKNLQPEKRATDGRLIVPGRLRDRLASDRLRLHDVAGSLYWAHGNYGLPTLAREYDDAVRLFGTVTALLENTTTQSDIRYREWLEKERAADAA